MIYELGEARASAYLLIDIRDWSAKRSEKTQSAGEVRQRPASRTLYLSGVVFVVMTTNIVGCQLNGGPDGGQDAGPDGGHDEEAGGFVISWSISL